MDLFVCTMSDHKENYESSLLFALISHSIPSLRYRGIPPQSTLSQCLLVFCIGISLCVLPCALIYSPETKFRTSSRNVLNSLFASPRFHGISLCRSNHSINLHGDRLATIYQKAVQIERRCFLFGLVFQGQVLINARQGSLNNKLSRSLPTIRGRRRSRKILL